MPATALPAADDLSRLEGLVLNPQDAIDAVNGNSYPYADGRNYLAITNNHSTDSIWCTPIPVVTIAEGDEELEATPVPIEVEAQTTKLIGAYSYANFVDPETNLLSVGWSFGEGDADADDVAVQLVHLY